MPKELAVLDAKLPAYLSAFLDEVGSNIQDKATVPSLQYRGKAWTISADGEKTKLTKRDEDGEEIAVQMVKVVILDYAKRRGRAYYEGNFDPDNQSAPLCWSDDGIVPHASVADKKSSKCETCPLAVKGSKISDNGKATVACGQHRFLAVVPVNNLNFTPLRLKLAITSDYDKQSPDLNAVNWFAFQQYVDYLKARGVNHTALVETKMKFDPNTDYPKVIFSSTRFLNEEEMAAVVPRVKEEAVAKLLSSTWTPNGIDGTKIDPDDEEVAPPAKKTAKPVEEPAKAKKAAPVDDDEDDAPPPPKAKKAAPVATKLEDSDEDDVVPEFIKKDRVKAAPEPAKAKKAAVVEDDEDDAPPPPKKAAKAAPVEDDEDAPPPKKAAKAEPAKAAKAEAPAGDLNSLLEEWGDE